ncbi:hypothetical protein SAMN05518865_101114 [Duganella sp. CF458]|uniref:hypothetical protein n=1 Tax=Duganella sp. CF458 TaxID=1884368 RepID=UPI0008EA27CB|nr:hypothetical protein [Duganella sp. CF458]SFF51664.1 hypothetical protein SAMN05518865_101114 [Duganella sp. CF458]
MSAKPDAIRPDWWSKTFAGAVLGGALALALAGLFAWAGPGGIGAGEKAQVVMWSIAPLWMTVFALVYLFRTGLRAGLWLGGANVLAYSLLFYVRSSLG